LYNGILEKLKVLLSVIFSGFQAFERFSSNDELIGTNLGIGRINKV